MKGVYPFGETTVDYGDMAQMNVPLYYHLYDAMHGAKSLFYDWYSALGINMTESVSIGSLLSPFNLFFYFVPRSKILQSMSFFTMIKLMAMSSTMFIFLYKKFKVHLLWPVVLGVNYAFCGFALQYYTNSQWLDIAAFFPLLMLSLDHLFKTKKILPYTIMLTICLITNFYNAMMVVMFVFFVSGLYLTLITPRYARLKKVWSLGLGTVMSALLSMFIVFPTLLQIMQSKRLSDQKKDLYQFFLDIYNATNYTEKAKWFMLFGVSFAVVVTVKGIIANKKDRKRNYFVIACILSVSLQVYFENVNLLWHGGSYVGFPMRFAYILTFVLISAACYYISKNPALNQLDNDSVFFKGINKTNKIFLGLLVMVIFVIFYMKVYKKTQAGDYWTSLFSFTVIGFVLFTCAYVIILSRKNRRINYAFISFILVAEMFLGGYMFIRPPVNLINVNAEQKSNFIAVTNKTKDTLQIPKTNLNRIKNDGNTLNSNYPFILQQPALSNWTHTVTGNIQKNFDALGYSICYTRLLDSGGTIFSDALLNVKNTLSFNQLDPRLYTYVKSSDKLKLYKNNYTLPFGITANESILKLNPSYSNHFEYQNALFRALSGEPELIHSIKYNADIDKSIVQSSDAPGDKQTINYTLNIPGNKVLYFYSGSADQQVNIYVNDKLIPVPSIENNSNMLYPILFNRNILSLGAFSNETVKLKFTSTKAYPEAQIQLALLDLDKLNAFTQKYNQYNTNQKSTHQGLTLTVNGTADKNILFLPIAYDDGWNCTINGKKADIVKIQDTFIGIKLQNGKNDIKMSFSPKGMNTGLLISLSALVLLIAGLYIKKKYKIKISAPRFLQSILETFFLLAWYGSVVVVYLVPVVYTLFFKVLLKA